MNYQGSKKKHVKHIMPFVEKLLAHSPDATYWEPFLGGGAMFTRVQHHTKRGSDIKEEVAALHVRMMDPAPLPGWIPPEYHAMVKADPSAYPAWERGFVLFCASFGNKYNDTYSGFDKRGAPPYGGECFNNSRAACSNVAKDQALYFYGFGLGHDVEICNCGYSDTLPARGDVVYCDPPYVGTTGYTTGVFDHGAFWSWVSLLEAFGVFVLVSEGSIHGGCSVLWGTSVNINMNKKAGNRGEFLMCLRGGITESALIDPRETV